MRLIKWLSSEKDSDHQRRTVMIFAFLGLRPRECVSLFSRFDITVEQLTQLRIVAHFLFFVFCLFIVLLHKNTAKKEMYSTIKGKYS